MKKVPIIFIGGLLGNSLYREDTSCFAWNDNLSFYLNPKKKRDITYFHYRENPVCAVNKPVQHFKIIPYLWENKVGFYILKELENLYGEKFSLHGSSLRYFFYDWRLSVDEVTKQLKEIIPAEPAVFICQSNGGLLALHLYNQLQEKFKARAVFLISPPFWGSFETLRLMRNGFFISKGLKLFEPHEAQSFPVSWDLLPYTRAEYLKQADFWLTRKWFEWKKIFDTHRNLEKTIEKGVKLHESLEPENIKKSGFPWYFYGSGYGKGLVKIKVTDDDIELNDPENEWLTGDTHTILDDLRTISNYETSDPEYISPEGFLFVNSTKENHRNLIAAETIRNSIIKLIASTLST